jgi:hypothetical protein
MHGREGRWEGPAPGAVLWQLKYMVGYLGKYLVPRHEVIVVGDDQKNKKEFE